MNRYIDADALKEKIGDTAFLKLDDTEIVEQFIDTAPSIDIVFCEDCPKHKVVPFGENACFYWCELRGHAVNADNFCSFGGMKTDE